MSKFKEKTITGISWNFVNQLLAQTVNIVLSIVLARLLTPEDFGIVGMVVVFSGFASVFVNFGFGSALVQKDDITQCDLSTVFWLNVSLGTLLALIFFFCADLIAIFYNRPLVKLIDESTFSEFFNFFFIYRTKLFSC